MIDWDTRYNIGSTGAHNEKKDLNQQTSTFSWKQRFHFVLHQSHFPSQTRRAFYMYMLAILKMLCLFLYSPCAIARWGRWLPSHDPVVRRAGPRPQCDTLPRSRRLHLRCAFHPPTRCPRIIPDSLHISTSPQSWLHPPRSRVRLWKASITHLHLSDFARRAERVAFLRACSSVLARRPRSTSPLHPRRHIMSRGWRRVLPGGWGFGGGRTLPWMCQRPQPPSSLTGRIKDSAGPPLPAPASRRLLTPHSSSISLSLPLSSASRTKRFHSGTFHLGIDPWSWCGGASPPLGGSDWGSLGGNFPSGPSVRYSPAPSSTDSVLILKRRTTEKPWCRWSQQVQREAQIKPKSQNPVVIRS